MQESAETAIKRAENIEGSNLRILSLRDEIIAQVEEMIQNLADRIKREKLAASLDPTDVPNLLKTVRMKIGHDEFESKLGTKADLKHLEAFEGKVAQIIKTEKFFLLMVNEVLKLI